MVIRIACNVFTEKKDCTGVYCCTVGNRVTNDRRVKLDYESLIPVERFSLKIRREGFLC